MPEAQQRIDSRQFAEWMAYLAVEPDIGTRLDWLVTVVVSALARVEAAMGGKPVPMRGKVIEWGRAQEQDETEVATALERVLRGNGTARN